MFFKLRFTSPTGATAGLVLPEHWRRKSIAELSRLFPVSEARFMQRAHASPMFETEEEAFAFTFPFEVPRV